MLSGGGGGGFEMGALVKIELTHSFPMQPFSNPWKHVFNG